MISNDRRIQILDCLNNETNEEWTQEWRDDLTPEELDFVAQEDDRYIRAVSDCCTVIIIQERTRAMFPRKDIVELISVGNHCRLRLRDGRSFLVRLRSDGSLRLDELEDIC